MCGTKVHILSIICIHLNGISRTLGFRAGVSLSGAGETRRIRTSASSRCNLLLNIFVVLAESRRPALYFLFV